MTHERLNVIFQGIIACGTFVGASIAIWGIFFSNIPERLTEEFNIEISEIRTQIDKLNEEKKVLTDDLSDFKNQELQLKAIVDQLSNERDLLIVKRSELQQQILTLNEEKQKYFVELYEKFLNNLMEIINKDISTLRHKAELARELPQVLEWMEKYRQLKKEKSTYVTLDWMNNYIKLIDEQPKAWGSELFREKWTRDGRGRDEEAMLSDFIEEITLNSDPDVITGKKLINKVILDLEVELAKFYSTDEDKIKIEMNNFIDKHSDIFEKPLEVRANFDYSNQEIISMSNEILSNILQLELSVNRIRLLLDRSSAE